MNLRSQRASPPYACALEMLAQLLTTPEEVGGRLFVPRMAGLNRPVADARWHERPELLIVMAGANRIRFPARTYELKAGRICLMPRGMPHSETFLHRHGRFRMLSLFFPRGGGLAFIRTDLTGDPATSSRHLGFALANDRNRIIAALDGVAQLAHFRDAWSRKARNGLLFGVLAWLGATLRSHAASGKRFTTKIRRAISLIEERLEDNDLGTSTLAARLGCAPDYLSDLFHQETGMTLIRYIHTQRMEKACFLLANSRLRVKEVSAACGFANPNYFCRVFRSLVGYSPREYCGLRRAK